MRSTSMILATITATAALSVACGPPAGSGGRGGAPGVGGGPGGSGPGGSGPGGTGGGTACNGMAPPATQNYAARGPFASREYDLVGPGGAFTIFRPVTLGEGGFKHPVATWGNGIITTPQWYPDLLGTIASHGFVIIASNSSTVTAQLLTQGLDWLIQQNSAAGEYNGKLAVDCAASIGYSLGGGAAVTAGSHRAVKVVASMHGLPGAAANINGPLLLTTSTSDGFVTKAGYVLPCYNGSTRQPTIMATLNVPGAPADFFGHLIPIGDGGQERGPMVAWLRYWIYGDQGARNYFFGNNCVVCTNPWIDVQRKNGNWQ